MKIVHIITSSRSWAGMEQYAYDLSCAMKERGDEMLFVIAADGDVVYPRFEKVGKVYLLPLKSKFDFNSIWKLRQILKSERPDIIHTHQPKNIFHAARARGAMRGMHIVHTLHFEIHPTAPHWLYKRIFDMPDRIISVSERVRQRVLSIYPNVNAQKVVRVLNSVDSSRLECLPGVEHDVPVIGYAGRLVEEKGVSVILRAVAMVKSAGFDFKLLLAGRGDEQYVKELHAIARELGLEDRVEFLGFVDRMGAFVSRLDIALLPSIVREACSLMLLEYMYLGKPVITTNNGGQVEVINDGVNGMLIEPSDAPMLADAIIKLLKDRELMVEMGAKAKEKFDLELSFPQFIDRTRGVYLDLLNQ